MMLETELYDAQDDMLLYDMDVPVEMLLSTSASGSRSPHLNHPELPQLWHFPGC